MCSCASSRGRSRRSGATASFRDSAESLAREVQLAAALSAAGAPIVAPLGGPYEACGLTVTLWPWIDTVPSGDAATAGHALRACHDALLGVDDTPLRLEPLGMLREARRLAATGPAEVALAVDHALQMLRATSNRIVHGDSHPGNVLWTADGPLWSDWEDAHLAPLEWDLAARPRRAVRR
jgi:Phosphotransferase enzyme family